MSQKSFKFSEATCQNLHFCSTLPALGSAAVRTYCQLTGLAWARRRLSAWHVRLCAGSCNAAVRFGSLSSWVCSWQVLAKRQWKAMQLSAEHVSQQKFWSSGCARGGAGGASAVLHTSVRQRHFCTWKPGVACRATDTRSGTGVWPAARTSDGRLRACCVMHRWPVRVCGVRRPMVGTQVMAVQLGSSVTEHFPNFLKFRKSPAFLGIWDYCHQSRQYSLPFKISRSYFRWRASL